MSDDSATKAFLGLVTFFGLVVVIVWLIYFWIKVAEHVNAWPF